MVSEKTQVGSAYEVESSEAKQEVGQCHSSDEVLVMRMERRALVIQF